MRAVRNRQGTRCLDGQARGSPQPGHEPGAPPAPRTDAACSAACGTIAKSRGPFRVTRAPISSAEPASPARPQPTHKQRQNPIKKSQPRASSRRLTLDIHRRTRDVMQTNPTHVRCTKLLREATHRWPITSATGRDAAAYQRLLVQRPLVGLEPLHVSQGGRQSL